MVKIIVNPENLLAGSKYFQKTIIDLQQIPSRLNSTISGLGGAYGGQLISQVNERIAQAQKTASDFLQKLTGIKEFVARKAAAFESVDNENEGAFSPLNTGLLLNLPFLPFLSMFYMLNNDKANNIWSLPDNIRGNLRDWITSPFRNPAAEIAKPTAAPTSGFGVLLKNMEEEDRKRQELADLAGYRAPGFKHINQFDAMAAIAPAKVSGNTQILSNADCGPTSVVMVISALGLNIPGTDPNSSPGDKIVAVRKSMATDPLTGVLLNPGKDGYASDGKISPAEHQGKTAYTNFTEMTRGIEAAGGKTKEIVANAATIKSSLEKGEKVIVTGSFLNKDPLPWTENRPGHSDAGAPGGAGDHIIAVTGYDLISNMFIVDDPARGDELNGEPFKVSATKLESFMSGKNAGALAVFK